LAIFRGSHRFAICMRLSKFRTFMITYPNHAGNKQKSYKIMKMEMLVTLDKTKLDTENVRGLNLAAVMCTTVKVSRLSW
jgi:hypothetical protein